jgi:hypothetical protein
MEEPVSPLPEKLFYSEVSAIKLLWLTELLKTLVNVTKELKAYNNY